MIHREEYVTSVKEAKKARGKNEMLKYVQGGRLTQAQAIRAYCFDCMNFFADGKADCGNAGCALYPFMPYNPNRQPAIERRASQKERV